VSLRGYKPKTRKACWTQVEGAQPVRAPAPREKKKKEPPYPKEYPAFARGIVKRDSANGRTCPVVAAIPELRDGMAYGHKISARIKHCHHIFGHGPNGELLMWAPGCVGVSVMGHRWIHSHPEEARKHGWYAPEGLWNNARKVLEIWQALASDEKLMDRMLTLYGYGSEHAKKV